MSDQVFDSTDALEEFKTLMSDPAARQAFVQVRAQKQERGARNRYEHILRAVGETPWAIRPAMLGVIIDILAFRVEGGRFTAEEIEERIGARRPAPPASMEGVAVIPLQGVIIPKAGGMSEMSGGTSIESFRNNFRQAMASPNVSSVVFAIDSPGGMVDGVPEMAAEIRAARGSKPIIAVADSEAASAAYWLAAQADQLIVTKSGRVGSIGVFTAHEDKSVHADQEGVKTTLVSAGKFKTEGNPFEPLSDGARAHMQSMVDNYYNMFVKDVAAGRGVPVGNVREGFGEGRIVAAADAFTAGMVDGIGTVESVVKALLSSSREKAAALSSSAHSHTHNLPNVAHVSIGDWAQVVSTSTSVEEHHEEPAGLERSDGDSDPANPQDTDGSPDPWADDGDMLDLETQLGVLKGKI